MGLGAIGSVGMTGSAWESKAIAVVRCVGNVDCKVEATLELMRHVTVPCSEEIQQLIVRSLPPGGIPPPIHTHTHTHTNNIPSCILVSCNGPQRCSFTSACCETYFSIWSQGVA